MGDGFDESAGGVLPAHPAVNCAAHAHTDDGMGWPG